MSCQCIICTAQCTSFIIPETWASSITIYQWGFCISVQHKKIKCIYIGHVSCLNYSSTFPVRETAQTVFTRQYFSRLHSPSDTFLHQSVQWVISCSFIISTTEGNLYRRLCNCYYVFLQLNLIFFLLSHTWNFLFTLILSIALSETTWRVGPDVGELNCSIQNFPKQKRIFFPAFCSFCASFILNMVFSCFSTMNFWIFICCPWWAIKWYL